jgi:hypothetical protein
MEIIDEQQHSKVQPCILSTTTCIVTEHDIIRLLFVDITARASTSEAGHLADHDNRCSDQSPIVYCHQPAIYRTSHRGTFGINRESITVAASLYGCILYTIQETCLHGACALLLLMIPVATPTNANALPYELSATSANHCRNSVAKTPGNSLTSLTTR